MTFPRRLIVIRVAIAVVLAISGVSMAYAQAPGGGGGRGGGALYTPAAGAKDLKAVLFNWHWYMGMLRSSEERDILASLEYQGKGTMQVDGQPCNVTKYRTSISYQTSGERVQITCTRANGQTYSNVEVLSGGYSWNEDLPGAELVAGKGKATPMPAAVQERMIRLWASPQGAPKAALAGVTNPPQMGPRPGTLVPADVAKAGTTSVAWEGGKPVVTFLVPGIPDAIATATLDAKWMAERVVVRQGTNTTEFTYSDYRDWNNPLHPAEAFYAGKMTERRNGTVLRDITTVETETGQMYVVMPVPASVRAAIRPTNQPPNWVSGFPPVAAAPVAAAQAVTPRLPNGKPDMTGTWNTAQSGPPGSGTRRCGPTQVGCNSAHNFTVDYAWISPSRYGPNRPAYKPEFWDKVQFLDQWTNKEDPIMTCQPMGIPRVGTPRRIFHTANDISMLYATSDYGGGNREFRVIPTDDRKHNPQKAIEATYNGYTVGRWEGETLVLDSISFVDTTWFGRGGYFHSANMRAVEKFTRKGDEILYEITIEDPDVLVEPWVMTPRTMRLSQAADAGLVAERAHCEIYEEGNISNQLRH
jgi:hypothetical protein